MRIPKIFEALPGFFFANRVKKMPGRASKILGILTARADIGTCNWNCYDSTGLTVLSSSFYDQSNMTVVYRVIFENHLMREEAYLYQR